MPDFGNGIPQPLSFEAALAAIRDGAESSLCGYTLTVNGIALAITDEQFDVVWDLMDEVYGIETADISLAGES